MRVPSEALDAAQEAIRNCGYVTDDLATREQARAAVSAAYPYIAAQSSSDALFEAASEIERLSLAAASVADEVRARQITENAGAHIQFLRSFAEAMKP